MKKVLLFVIVFGLTIFSWILNGQCLEMYSVNELPEMDIPFDDVKLSVDVLGVETLDDEYGFRQRIYYSVTNTLDEQIWLFEPYIRVTDSEGGILNSALYGDGFAMTSHIDYPIDPGEKVYARTLNIGGSPDDTIMLEGYGYRISDRERSYLLDIDREVVVDYYTDTGIPTMNNNYWYNGDADFDAANIVKVDSMDCRFFDGLFSGNVTMHNSGSIPIVGFECAIGVFSGDGCYFDELPHAEEWGLWFNDEMYYEEGDQIINDFEYRYENDWYEKYGLEPKNLALLRYEYLLEEPDEFGNQYYIIDLKWREAIGYSLEGYTKYE